MTHTKNFQVGESVLFATMPPWVERLPAESQAVFRFCLGRTYEISDITDDGLLVLDVSADIDARFGGFMNDIRVEPEFVSRQGP